MPDILIPWTGLCPCHPPCRGWVHGELKKSELGKKRVKKSELNKIPPAEITCDIDGKWHQVPDASYEIGVKSPKRVMKLASSPRSELRN